MTHQPPPPPGDDHSDQLSGAPAELHGGEPAQPHNFAAQNRLHRQIRNDPDYDDWDYGTEPLPKEAWVSSQPPT